MERRMIWPAYAAAAWAFIFGVFHMIWASGWYVLLADPVGAAAGMGAVPWKWWYDVAAGAMCFVAVPVALAPVMAWGRRVSARLVFVLACIGTGLLVLRFAASVAQTVYLVALGRFQLSMVGRWEPWFWSGTILFVLSTWQSRRNAGREPLRVP